MIEGVCVCVFVQMNFNMPDDSMGYAQNMHNMSGNMPSYPQGMSQMMMPQHMMMQQYMQQLQFQQVCMYTSLHAYRF